MADITPEQAQIAVKALAGGFGAGVAVYLRHPGSIIRVVAMFAIGIGMAVIFTDPIVALLGFSEAATGAAIGICGIPIANSALKAAERLDLASLVRKKD